MSLKDISTRIEKACIEANNVFLKKRSNQFIQQHNIFSNEAIPVLEKVSVKYNLEVPILVKILDIKPSINN